MSESTMVQLDDGKLSRKAAYSTESVKQVTNLLRLALYLFLQSFRLFSYIGGNYETEEIEKKQ